MALSNVESLQAAEIEGREEEIKDERLSGPERSKREAGHLLDSEEKSVVVKNKAKDVSKGNVYVKANYLIGKSRRYIPKKVLREYMYFRFFKEIFYIVLGAEYSFLSVATTFLMFLESFIFGLSIVQLVFGIFVFLLCIPIFVILFQHIHVIVWTLPWVLSQPYVKEQEELAKEVTVNVDNLPNIYTKSRNFGLGIVEKGKSVVGQPQDTIRFLVLNESGVMSSVISGLVSVFLLCLNVAACVWAVILIILTSLQLSSQALL